MNQSIVTNISHLPLWSKSNSSWLHLIGWIRHVSPASIPVIMIAVKLKRRNIHTRHPSSHYPAFKHSMPSQTNSNQLTLVRSFSINHLHQPNQFKLRPLTILHKMSFDRLYGLEMHPEETTFSWTSDSNRPGWWISDYFGVQATGIWLLRLATRHLQTDS